MKKIFLLSIMFLLTCAIASAQELPLADSNTVSMGVLDIQPEYPGGTRAFMEYIVTSMKNVNGRKSGRMLVSFVVEIDGRITNVSIVKGLQRKLDRKVKEVISNSAKWKPGVQNGRLVRVSYQLPVVFKFT